MIHECDPKHKEILKQAECLINEHEAIMDTMLVKIKDDYIGYQPELVKGHKKKYVGAEEKRLKEIQQSFNVAEKLLKDNDIELLVCFVSLKEGGAVIMVSGDAVEKYKAEVFNKLQKMEEKYDA